MWAVRAYDSHGNQTGSLESDARRTARSRHACGTRRLSEWPNGQEQGRCPVNGQRLLTLREVADMLRLSPHTIRAMVRKHKLEPVRICRRLLFDPADVERLIYRS